VVQRTAHRLRDELVATMSRVTPAELDEGLAISLVERIVHALNDTGHARLLVWLHLIGAEDDLESIEYGELLCNLARVIHSVRERRDPSQKPSWDDTLFTVQLAALALFGNAVAGAKLRESAGGSEDEFIAWFAKLLHERFA